MRYLVIFLDIACFYASDFIDSFPMCEMEKSFKKNMTVLPR